MHRDEIRAFLQEQGHGVLAFNTDEPYAVPVSYGFGADADRCFLQLYFGPDSRKRRHVVASPDVCLVVYEWTDPLDWRSVVIIGSLTELDDAERDVMAGRYVDTASIPDLSVFSAPLEDHDVGWYELEISSMEGRSPSG